MKKFLFLLFALSSCIADEAEETSGEQEERPFAWLLGSWQRSNETEGRQTFEFWDSDEAGEFVGLGFTMDGSDTVFKEQLRLMKIDSAWHLKVSGVHNHAVYFAFTAQTDSSFVCENPENEFPKIIEYWRSGNELNARISGGQESIAFQFLPK
ncbi:DUF6265 family protein [Marinilongibacter aquaticus]|uniref:DUF6265 family protein n=1 Tax=Marinilongibacter aquaticus TaxID=2975157 RepID=UPI0021BD1ECC|nr:DUF6265 family protein [Marinilongibacter aquaticus]UBM60196.1 DUF6265 family protein [Marinilongibacter aquaticus]